MSLDQVVRVIDDDPAVRESLIYLLQAVDHVACSYASAEELLDAEFDASTTGCFLIDVRLPGMDGLALQQELVGRGIRAPVIVVSAHGDIAMAVAAMRNGAFDFVEKPFDDRELLDRVESALAFERRQRERFRVRDEIAQRMVRLTERERQVLDLVVEGDSTKTIAGRLGTSFNTVQNQRASILRKMEARSVADVVRMVMTVRAGEEPTSGTV